MDLTDYKNNLIDKIDYSLRIHLENGNPKIKHLGNHYKSFSDSHFGGKFLRGILVCLGYKIAKDNRNKDILDVASAFEMLHTSLLIHDDIIDESNLRRGKPSLHVSLGGTKKGESLALCFGDLGIIWAIQTINNSSFKNKHRQWAVDYFCHNIKNTVYGELLDVELSKSLTKDEKDILKIHELKTSAYSFVAPLGVGMILGGYNPNELATVKLFGTNLGIAFQIQDDILGVFGNEDTLGKPVTSDICEGKNTLLISNSLRHATSSQMKRLNELYGNPNVTLEDCQEVKAIFMDTGSYEYSISLAKKHLRSAQRLIPKITKNHEHQILLYEFSKAVLLRDK